MICSLFIQSVVFLSFDLPGQATIYFLNTDFNLVVWGEILSSNVGNPRFSPLVSSMIQLSPYLKGIIVGLILSDAGLRLCNPRSKNCRLGFQQTFEHFDYFWHVFTKLSYVCISMPKLYIRRINGTIYYALDLYTPSSPLRGGRRGRSPRGRAARSLPCFTELHSLFYARGVARRGMVLKEYRQIFLIFLLLLLWLIGLWVMVVLEIMV